MRTQYKQGAEWKVEEMAGPPRLPCWALSAKSAAGVVEERQVYAPPSSAANDSRSGPSQERSKAGPRRGPQRQHSGPRKATYDD